MSRPGNKRFRDEWDRIFNEKHIVAWYVLHYKEGGTSLELIDRNLNHKYIEFSSAKEAEDYITENFG